MACYDCSEFKNRTFYQVLSYQAEIQPHKTWIVSDERSITYRDAFELAKSTALVLARMGVKRGEVVAAMLPSSPEAIIFGMGVIFAGAVFTAIDTNLKKSFLASRVLASTAQIVVVADEYADRLSNAISDCQNVHMVQLGDLIAEWDGIASSPEQHASRESVVASDARPDDDAIVWWTSGTTGEPKGVVHSNSSALYIAWRSARNLPIDTVYYCCTPMYLGGAWLTSIFPTMIAGAQIAVDRRFSVSTYWSRIAHFRATHSLLLGAMHTYLMDIEETPEEKNNTLRNICCIPISSEDARKMRDRFGLEDTPQFYGMTETGSIFEMISKDSWEPREIGSPSETYDFMIVDDNDQPVPRGTTGEVVVRPREPGVMFKRYLNSAEDTVKATRNLWFHCGDLLREDEQGRFYFAGRKKEYVRHKGRSVSLYQVDCAALAHPDIVEAAAIGVPALDDDTEEELALVVVRHEASNVSALDLATFINENAPYYFVPRYIFFVDQLPHQGHGKVARHRVKADLNWSDVWDARREGFKAVR